MNAKNKKYLQSKKHLIDTFIGIFSEKIEYSNQFNGIKTVDFRFSHCLLCRDYILRDNYSNYVPGIRINNRRVLFNTQEETQNFIIKGLWQKDDNLKFFMSEDDFNIMKELNKGDVIQFRCVIPYCIVPIDHDKSYLIPFSAIKTMILPLPFDPQENRAENIKSIISKLPKYVR